MAINDGYSKENIILIPEKESGIKLSEEERKGITTLKKHIENDDTINCVYLWEISRLARRQKVLMSIREYLIERKINIKIKTPTCSLLNADGTLNEGADLIFSLYSQMSEAEMRTKIERFRRTKKVNSEKMKFSGGKIMFGYKVDENGYYQIDDEQAEIIRLIYNLYINNNLGTLKLLKELNERGYPLKGFQIDKILSNTAYIGFKEYPNGNNRKYPPIITPAIFEQAQRKKEENKTNTDKSRKHIWLCAKLIKCTECGGYMMANAGARVYSCKAHTHKNFYNKNCSNKTSANISAVDGIAWHYAKSLYVNEKLEDIEKQIANNETQIAILQEKIKASDIITAEFDRQEKRITDAYQSKFSSMTKEQFDEKLKNVYDERIEFEKKITEFHNEIQKLNDEILFLKKDRKEKSVVQKLKDRLKIMQQDISQEEKYNIVHRYIKYIEIQEATLYYHTNEFYEVSIHRERTTPNDKARKAREIKIYGVNGETQTYYFMYTQKKWQQQFARYIEKYQAITPTFVTKQ